MQTAIPYMQIRGGSSKGLYFHAKDLPGETTLRDKVLLAAMCGVGPDDIRQIDGLGGAEPLTSKVGIVSPSTHAKADIDYEFVQIVVGKGVTDRTQNCGNILAGVVPFAIESGLITTADATTVTRVFMCNSKSICEVTVQTPAGQLHYHGDCKIDGVPGTAAPIVCNYEDIAGSICGSLLPTGNLIDEVEGIQVTCIDNGMPVVMIRATDLNCSAYETPAQLNTNSELKAKLENIRLQIGTRMNLGDVTNKVIPKLALINKPIHGGYIHTRTFIPHKCHAAIGVLGAVSIATACVLPDTVAKGLTATPKGNTYSIEHPTGKITISLDIDFKGTQPIVKKAGVLRTARLLSRGEVMLPVNVWNKN